MKRAVLVRPEGPRNVGMALRAAANFGPCELVVVGPVKPSLLVHPDFEQMAHGVAGGGERVRVCGSLGEALAESTWSVGFTARARGHWSLRDWRDAREEVAARANAPGESLALVFGNEVTGLSGEDCALCQDLVRVATAEEHGSLNLAMAVTIALSECFAGPPGKLETQRGEPLVGRDREYLRLHVRDVLPGLTRSESYRKDLEASIDRVFRRAPLETRDARAWHGLMRALGNAKTPADFGLEGNGGRLDGSGGESAPDPPTPTLPPSDRPGAGGVAGLLRFLYRRELPRAQGDGARPLPGIAITTFA